jgi:hypothetical protein
MRWLLASLFMLIVLHVACGRSHLDMSGPSDGSCQSEGTCPPGLTCVSGLCVLPDAGTGGGGGSQLPGVSTGGSWGGTEEPAGGGAAGSTSSSEPNTGGHGPVPAGSLAGASAMAGTSATGGSVAGNPASRSSSVAGQPGPGGTSTGGRLTVAGTTSIIGGSGGTSKSAASGGSSSSGGGSCTEVTACGGDVVGTWEVKSQCLTFDGQADIAYLGLTCVPDVASIKGSLKVTGKLTLGSDGKYKDATTTTGSEVWQLDKSCLILSGTKVNCASIGTTFEGALKGFGYESMDCTDASSGGGCTCADTINTDATDGRPGGMGILYNDATTKGVYKTNGNKLTLGELSYTYCVKGNEMTVSPIPIENSATPYNGTIVMSRSVVPTGGTGGNGGTTATGGKAGSGGGGRAAP